MRRMFLFGTILLVGVPPSIVAQTNDAKKSHWAFQPVRRPPLPEVKQKDWMRNPIDAFILARLEKAKLPPSKEADRATLIRRLKFDVLGLPPTPEELGAFVKGADPHAYEKLVDQYLASPHFGERWARHWLDAVRFAESDGLETNQPRANAWPYRDYVIRSLNEGKPYDRFIMEQLAGDQLGAPEATGFLVGGPHDKVKSPDINLTLMQRGDELHDIINTTGATFLGLTVGCARCHDHKFDPISIRDYYGMRAIFAGVQHGERPIKKEADAARIKDLRRQLAELGREINARRAVGFAECEGAAPRSGECGWGNVEKFALWKQNTSASPLKQPITLSRASTNWRYLPLAQRKTSPWARRQLPPAIIPERRFTNWRTLTTASTETHAVGSRTRLAEGGSSLNCLGSRPSNESNGRATAKASTAIAWP